MTTTDIQFFKSLLAIRYRLMQIGVSKNGLTDQKVGSLIEKIERIVSPHALAIFIRENIKDLLLLPPAQSQKTIDQINKLFDESITMLNTEPNSLKA